MSHSVYTQSQVVLSLYAVSGQDVRLPHHYHGHLPAMAAGVALGLPVPSPFFVVAHDAQAHHHYHGRLPVEQEEAEELAL